MPRFNLWERLSSRDRSASRLESRSYGRRQVQGVMIAEISFILAGFLNHSRSLNNRLPAPVFVTIYQQADPA
jgi:hypothetical protein